MSRTLNKYITVLNYTERLVLSSAGGSVSLFSFTTVIGTPIQIASADIIIVFLISSRIFKIFLKTRGTKNKHRKIASLARSELNSIEKIISQALIDSVISHGEFAVAFNEEQNYRILKDSIRAKGDQLGDIERDRLIDHRKKIGQNQRQNLKLQTELY